MPSITVEPCTFALFGALGDLALRKLFPALYQLDRANLLHPDTRLPVSYTHLTLPTTPYV